MTQITQWCDHSLRARHPRMRSQVGLRKHHYGHRTRKGQFSSQSLRKAIPKNAQTTAQLHSSHTVVK